MLDIKIFLYIILMTLPKWVEPYSNNSARNTGIHNFDLLNQHVATNGFISKSSKEDDETYKFLVTGGYRPDDQHISKYLVSIRQHKMNKYFGDSHFCGGVIIGKKAILTAAHCFFHDGSTKTRASHILVVAGTPKRLKQTSATQELEVDKVKTHPKFSSESLQNDIAILKLKKEINIDDKYTGIIDLPPGPPVANKDCTVIGWGRVIEFGPLPDEVVFADMKIREYDFCKQIKLFAKGMLCAGDPFDFQVDSCHGDSGGPLICNEKSVGIVSYGFGCGEPGSAGVYTDVDYYHKWILENSSTHLTPNSFVSLSLIMLGQILLLHLIYCIF